MLTKRAGSGTSRFAADDTNEDVAINSSDCIGNRVKFQLIHRIRFIPAASCGAAPSVPSDRTFNGWLTRVVARPRHGQFFTGVVIAREPLYVSGLRLVSYGMGPMNHLDPIIKSEVGVTGIQQTCCAEVHRRLRANGTSILGVITGPTTFGAAK